MKKMKMETGNITERNIDKIAALFPNCITEAPDGNGGIKRAVNFDMLRQMLSGDVVEGDEAYEFTWVGKKAAIVEANKPIRMTLRPCPEESVDWDHTENLYIEGDNLEVLKLLQESYLGKVKMIYIDPPYNTGHDFVYPDSYIMDNEEYDGGRGYFDDEGNVNFSRENSSSDGRYHSDWCSMMYSRLTLARNLLLDDGVIFISIDDNEANNLIKICEEIFGESNFVGQFPWQSRQSIQNDTDMSINHEYIVVFAKRRRQENRRLKESNASTWFNHESFAFLPIPLDKSKFDNPDNDPRGLWKADPMDAPNVRPNLTYPITNPNTGVQHLPPSGRHWRILPEKFSSAVADNRIVWGKDGNGRPQLKVFYSEKKMYGSIDNSWWTAERFGTATQGTKELMQIFGRNVPFDTPKPTKLLYELLKMTSLPNDGDIILDFFSGSATTAHAVMQLNVEDGGRRKFIMVQLPEPCDEKSEAYKAGYQNICEIGKERIRRAGAKIKSENPESAAGLDTGFRVFKLDDTNMKDVYYAAGDYEQNLISMMESNIKENRTDLDLLFGCLLEWGLPLSLPYTSEEIDGCKVHTYNGGDLIACFDENVPDSVVKTIARRQPLRAVFRDASFADSPSKINVGEIFKLLAPDTRVKVI